MTPFPAPALLRLSHFLGFVAVAAVVGLVVFGALVWDTSTVERVDAATARARFDETRAALGNGPARVEREEGGGYVRREAPVRWTTTTVKERHSLRSW